MGYAGALYCSATLTTGSLSSHILLPPNFPPACPCRVEPTAALSASFAASAVAPSAAPAASSSSGSANASAGGFATGTQTVSMTLVMQILGQSILPFNQTTQANAATAMANVFGIVIGTGNVRILSSQQVRLGGCLSSELPQS